MSSPEQLLPPRDFQYSASGTTIAGRIKRPFPSLIQVPPCVLQPVGGRASARTDKFQLGEILHVDRAQADAFGIVNDKREAWQTGIRVQIDGANILDVLVIGRIEAMVTSSYPVNSGLPRFSVDEISYKDLRIAGTHVGFDINQEFHRNPTTYNDFRTAILHQDIRSAKPKAESRRDFDSPILTSLVTELRADSKSFQIEGNAIRVPEFGRISFADLAIEPERRTLTMLRVELDGVVVGEIDLGTIVVNGISGRSSWQREPGYEQDTDRSTGLELDEEAEVVDDLKHWLNTNPRQDEPFLFFMGRSLTPRQFFDQVETRTDHGLSFLRFLAEQSKISDQRPRDVIRRAVDANKAE